MWRLIKGEPDGDVARLEWAAHRGRNCGITADGLVRAAAGDAVEDR